MYVKKENRTCSGCGLCAQMCSQRAITMTVGKDGYLYPTINESLCTKCGACERICPFDKKYVSENSILESYAIKHSDEIRQQSSSGGFFTLLSEYILKNNGVVYGAVWTSDFSVTHIRADNPADRDRMRSSKYIQSRIDHIYEPLKKDVASGKLVLFTGTPCQCAAISKLFGKNSPENLWIMDMICYGVLSQKFFNEYLQDIQSKHSNVKIEKVNLRDKRYGVQTVGVDFDDGSTYHGDDDYFYKAYSFHALQRESCFTCPCANEERFGDFTVGDFWGSRQSRPDFHDELGISLVIVNTPKAGALFQELKKEVVSIAIEKNVYMPYQPNLRKPTQKGERAERFRKYYRKHGYKKTMHRFFDKTLMRKINSSIYSFLKNILRKQ